MIDELVQVRGGRGYETAESLKARGEKPIPVEQALRDMRINRIFEGSTEIMHLLIAREAVDQHLQVAGDILENETPLGEKAKSAVAAGAFYGKWLPKLVVGEGHKPKGFDEFGELATHLRYAERSSRRLARSTFYAMGRWQAKLEQRQSFLGRIVDIGAELFAISAAVVYADTIARETPERADSARELADLFCAQARRRADALFHDAVEQRRRRRLQGRDEPPRRALHLARRGRERPRRPLKALPGRGLRQSGRARADRHVDQHVGDEADQAGVDAQQRVVAARARAGTTIAQPTTIPASARRPRSSAATAGRRRPPGRAARRPRRRAPRGARARPGTASAPPSATRPLATTTIWLSRLWRAGSSPPRPITLLPHIVPMQSMKTAIGTIALNAPATPMIPTTQPGSSRVTMLSSARSLRVEVGDDEQRRHAEHHRHEQQQRVHRQEDRVAADRVGATSSPGSRRRSSGRR